MGSGTSNDNLTAAFIGNTAVIRVEGRGSFKEGPPLKQFVHRAVDNRRAGRILVDMAACTGMDSTFMGVAAGLSCYVGSKPERSFKLVNLSEKNQKLLTTLGVDRVVDYSASASPEERELLAGPADGEPLPGGQASKLDTAKTSLEAHETLVAIHPENIEKFKSVLAYLQDDVRSLANP